MELAMIGNRMLPLDKVDPAYLDRGTFFGDGVYEVLRSYDGKLFAVDAHFERFARSLKEIAIDGVDVDEIRAKVIGAYQKSEIANASIYFHVTRGSGLRSHNWDAELEPNFFMTITELPDFSQIKRDGVRLCVEPDLRWKRCDIKSLNLLPNVMAKQNAVKKGCYEAILVDAKGDITEGSSSAFFAIFGDDIVTRPLGHEILPSITRRYVKELSELVGLGFVEKTITPDDAKKADELFIAVTSKDVLGAIEFDGAEISGGKVGPWTRKLEAAFKEMIAAI